MVSRLADGRIELINDNFERLFGYSRAEVIGKTSLQLNLIADPAQRDEMVWRMWVDGFLRDFEADIHLRSDEIRQVKLSIEMLAIANEPYILTIIEDITERKRVEAEKQQLEERYATLFKSVHEGFAHYKAVYDDHKKLVDFLVVEINPAGAHISGVARDAQVGQTWRQMWPGVNEQLFALYQRADETGEIVRFEDHNLMTGRIYDVTINKIAPGEFVVTFFDITEQKRTEHALLEAHRQTVEILEIITDGFFSIDREWRVTYINERAAEQGGYRAEDLIGKVIWDSVPALHGSNLEAIYRQVMADRQAATTDFYCPRSGRWFQVRVSPSTVGISVFSQDVTEQKWAAEW